MRAFRYLLGGIVLCTLVMIVFFEMGGGFFPEPVDMTEPVSITLQEIASWPDAKEITIRVPRKFFIPGVPNSGIGKGINLITFYPTFISTREARKLGYQSDCVGYCNGRVMISFENRGLRGGAANATDNWAALYMKAPTIYRSPYGHEFPAFVAVDREPQFGFDRVFDHETHPGGGPDITSVDRYLFKYNETRTGFDLVAKCHMQVPVPACALYFSPRCEPALSIEVIGWQYERMAEAMNLWKSAKAFVFPMLTSPACHD
jgi:hypothetical protein